MFNLNQPIFELKPFFHLGIKNFRNVLESIGHVGTQISPTYGGGFPNEGK
jgi:hypothetical protein